MMGFLDFWAFWEKFWNTICSKFAPIGGGLALPTYYPITLMVIGGKVR